MSHGEVAVCTNDEVTRKKGHDTGGTHKKNRVNRANSFVIDEDHVLDLTEFESVLYAFKALSSYNLQSSDYHKLTIQVEVASGHRFDDFDQSLALRVGQYFKSKSMNDLRVLIQEV